MPSTGAFGIKTSPAGIPYPTHDNIATILSHDPLFIGRCWYDSFLDRMLTGSPAHEWIDSDDIAVVVDLQSRYDFRGISKSQVRDTLNYRCRQSPRHVVRDWLVSLVWDGEPRIELALEDHWGAIIDADTQPSEYVRAVSRNFFIGLVARIFRPGCQLDHVVVFESPQGLGKTSALRVLGGAWYMAAHEKITRKDFFQDLQGKWIIEISEMSSFSNADVERIKSVISTSSDRFRGSYDHRSSDHPRQCVFAGTTNQDAWGHDETGLRRFWPIVCGDIRIDTLTVAREQLFAEAVVLFLAGATWWEVPIVASDVQEDHTASDPWEPYVRAWLLAHPFANGDALQLAELYEGALKGQPKELTVPSSLRLGKILRRFKWTKRTTRFGGSHPRGKGWFPPVTPY